MRAQLAGAFLLLTRLPVPWPAQEGGAWAWPLVGMVVGALGGAVDWALRACGASPALAAAWTLAALVLLTGGLHEDGLADTADGFGGGGTRARKLEIMRDSRIGSYGALALIISLAVRGAAIAAFGTPRAVLAALVVSGALGRAAMIMPLLRAAPARPDGMAAGLPALPPGVAAAGFGIGLLCVALLAPARAAVALVVATAAVALGVTALAIRQIGGYSGDVLGAVELVTETVALSVLSVLATG